MNGKIKVQTKIKLTSSSTLILIAYVFCIYFAKLFTMPFFSIASMSRDKVTPNQCLVLLQNGTNKTHLVL